MAKNSVEAYGGKGTQKVILIAPEELKLVTDKTHALFDKRVELPVDEALVESIMSIGILQAIGIHKNAETGDVEVVWGRQRVKAAIEANKRLKKKQCEPVLVPCAVRRSNDGSDLLGVSVTENELRQNDSPLGRAEKMRRLIEMGRSEAQLATIFGCTQTTVKNTLSLLEASGDVRRAVESGKISASVGYRLAKEEPEEQKKRLTKILKSAPAAPVQDKRGKGSIKRRSKGAGKKAREIASGVSEGRNKGELVSMRNRIENHEEISESDRKVAVAVFEWVLGFDKALDEIWPDVFAEEEEEQEEKTGKRSKKDISDEAVAVS